MKFQRPQDESKGRPAGRHSQPGTPGPGQGPKTKAKQEGPPSQAGPGTGPRAPGPGQRAPGPGSRAPGQRRKQKAPLRRRPKELQEYRGHMLHYNHVQMPVFTSSHALHQPAQSDGCALCKLSSPRCPASCVEQGPWSGPGPIADGAARQHELCLASVQGGGHSLPDEHHLMALLQVIQAAHGF